MLTAADEMLDGLAVAHVLSHPRCEARVGFLSWWGLVRRWSKQCAGDVVGVVTCRWCGSATSACASHRDVAIAESPIGCEHCGSVGLGSVIFHFTGVM